MKKIKFLQLTISIMLGVLLLNACNSSSDQGPKKFLLFEGNELVLSADSAYRYDEPIILEGEDVKNFGGWLCAEQPAVYWGITIPERGDYEVTVTYSREEEVVANGILQTLHWSKDKKDWVDYTTVETGFDSTGSWGQYSTLSAKLYAMDAGAELIFLISPDYQGNESYTHFINLQSVTIKKASEPFDIYGKWYQDGDINSDVFTVNEDDTWEYYQIIDGALVLVEEGTVEDASNNEEIKMRRSDGGYRIISIIDGVVRFSNRAPSHLTRVDQ